MQRKSFFKSIVGLIIAPKIIYEIDWGKKRVLPVHESACVDIGEIEFDKGYVFCKGEIQIFRSQDRVIAIYKSRSANKDGLLTIYEGT